MSRWRATGGSWNGRLDDDGERMIGGWRFLLERWRSGGAQRWSEMGWKSGALSGEGRERKRKCGDEGWEWRVYLGIGESEMVGPMEA